MPSTIVAAHGEAFDLLLGREEAAIIYVLDYIE
jgi:hypothetical protein